MAHQKLQIEQIDTKANSLRLSNGHKYLCTPEDSKTAAGWGLGATVWLSAVSYPPNGFEVRSAEAMEEFIIVSWVSS